MTRSVLEGVSYGLRDSFELMKASGLERIAQVRVTGGGARSSLWRQILADVFNAEIVTVNTTEGAAYGAGLLAAVGVGAFESVDAACDATISIAEKTMPGENVEVYNQQYPRYRELYPALKSIFHQM
jgi:xylulokinase